MGYTHSVITTVLHGASSIHHLVRHIHLSIIAQTLPTNVPLGRFLGNVLLRDQASC